MGEFSDSFRTSYFVDREKSEQTGAPVITVFVALKTGKDNYDVKGYEYSFDNEENYIGFDPFGEETPHKDNLNRKDALTEISTLETTMRAAKGFDCHPAGTEKDINEPVLYTGLKMETAPLKTVSTQKRKNNSPKP